MRPCPLWCACRGVASWWTVMGTDRGANTFTFKEYQTMIGLTFGVGSLLYFFGSMAALMWTSCYCLDLEQVSRGC